MKRACMFVAGGDPLLALFFFGKKFLFFLSLSPPRLALELVTAAMFSKRASERANLSLFLGFWGSAFATLLPSQREDIR